jgi:hypothetical protein
MQSELTNPIMETDETLNSSQARIHTLNLKIFQLKDRIARETDLLLKGKMVSVLVELEEFRKMLQSLQDYSGTPRPDYDLYLTEMENNIFSGRRSFRDAFKNAGIS